MFQNLSSFRRNPLRHFPCFIAVAAVLVLVLALVACSSSSGADETAEETSDGLALVWEAWEQINQNYVSSEPLEPESVISGAMARVLDLVDITPYPFLTDIGRMRGQPPSHVPSEMVDLWRAVAKYKASNPDFDLSTVAEVAVVGMLAGLGDTSAVFLDPVQYPLAKESLEGGIEGSYLGIGARVVAQDGWVVLFPFTGSPAERAGVQPGDVLSAVAGASVVGQSAQEVVEQVRVDG